jgi:hypothetical protein
MPVPPCGLRRFLIERARGSLCMLTVAAFTPLFPAANAATFTYNGTLQDGGNPAEGRYDLELTLYASSDSRPAIAGPLLLHAVQVHGGKFITRAEFPGLADDAAKGYVGVRVAESGSGTLLPLTGREQISANSPTCPGAWDLSGNAGNPSGSFLGTVDAQPLVFEVNGLQVGAIEASGETNVPNVEFGSSSNTFVVGAVAAVVSGGSANTAGNEATVGGGSANRANGGGSTISGGDGNAATGSGSTVSGGAGNIASGDFAVARERLIKSLAGRY